MWTERPTHRSERAGRGQPRPVESGYLTDHYRWQIETQLMVSKAQVAHLRVFDGKEGILLEVSPNPERWTSIQEA